MACLFWRVRAGITQVLALVFKAGQRAALLPLARQLWPAASCLLSSEAAASSVLTRCGARHALYLLEPILTRGSF